jgi:hypothetical protein
VDADVSFSDGQADSPSVGIDGRGNATAVWNARADLEGATRPAGGQWQRPVVVAATPGYPRLAVNAAGDAVAVWAVAGVGYPVNSAVRSLEDPAWRSAGAVSPSSTGHIDGLSIDAQGNAIAAWPGSNAEGGTWAAGLDAAGPALLDLRIPSHGYAGQRLSFSVRPADAWTKVSQPSWEFGDRSTNSGRLAMHTYSKPGTYQVFVSASDSLGHTSRVARVVKIRQPLRLRNVRRPRIAGRVRIHATLLCLPGRWLGTQPIDYTYRWRVDGRIAQNGRRFTVHPSHRRSLIGCVVTAHNYAGSKVATSADVRVG